MTAFPRPRLVVSRCLGFEACRWNAAMIPDDHVDALRPHVEFVTVCPEVQAGLGVPRDPVRVVVSGPELRLVQQNSGRDWTGEMTSFSDRFLSGVGEVDGFLLKSRSPSCGVKDTKVYPGLGKVASLRTAPGFFGGAVLSRFPGHAVEDEGRLNNERIWDHFLRKLFTLASYRVRVAGGSMKDLVEFHASNKMLLMAYSQKEMRELGRIAANRDKRPFGEVAGEYRAHLGMALATIPRPAATVNAAMHMLGFSSKSLTGPEKSYFLDLLERYRQGLVPLAALSAMLRSWALRFGQDYILSQTFLDPYPAELAGVVKTGEARDLKR